jgi:transcriptional regulator with XRE-family HTH domain
MGIMSDRDAVRAGRYVLARRGELGMTQEQLARAAKVDPKTVNSLEHGERWPWARNIARLETALGWPPLTLEKIAAGGEPPGAEPELPATADATVSVLEGALSAGERYIMASDLDPEFAAEMVKAWREVGLGDLIAAVAAMQRKQRNG